MCEAYMCVYRYKAIYYKKLAHVIMEVDKSQICSGKAGDAAETKLKFKYKGCLETQVELAFQFKFEQQEKPIVLLQRPSGRKNSL